MSVNNQRLPLQQYLDKQIALLHSEAQQTTTFDQLQLKLASIQSKLHHLKQQNYPAATPSTQKRKESRVISSNRKNQQKDDDAEKNIQATPYKRLVLQSKILNQGLYFHNKTNQKLFAKSPAVKTNEKKNDFSTAKKQKSSIDLGSVQKHKKTLTSVKKHQSSASKTKMNTRSQRKLKVGHESSNFASWQMASMQREIRFMQKSNVDLKKKVNELRGYETEYRRMKQMFSKCERLRKKGKLV